MQEPRLLDGERRHWEDGDDGGDNSGGGGSTARAQLEH